MTVLEMWSLLLGSLLPLLLAVVQQPKWPQWLRVLVTVVICVVVGLGNVYFNGSLLHTTSIVEAILLVLVAALSTYHGLWKPSGIAPKLESATSPGQGTHDNPTADPPPPAE
jgi:amino acid transporter